MRRQGRPPTWTDEQREQVLALAAEGASQRAIAEAVFADARYRGRIERILRERAISPRDGGRALEGAYAGVVKAFAAGDVTSVRELVCRYERSLLGSEEVPSIADVERLLKIKRQLHGLEELERLRELTRERR